MSRNKYDVIIIGAGPGGLECARVLQQTEMSVLVVEQNDVIGPKTCAGGVTEIEEIVDIPDSLCKLFFRETLYLDKVRYETELRYKRKVFDRFELGQYQLKKINKKRVDVLTGVRVQEIRAGKIVTNKGEYEYKYLVGADGSSSIVRKYLGLPSKYCQGLYYEIPGEFNEFVAYYNHKTIKSGYIWEFPHKTHNNVGIYFDLEYLKPSDAKKYLDEYISEHGLNHEGARFCGALVNYDFRGYEFGNVLLVGDAGGFTSRLHGGGINNAMASGRDVAMKIIDPTYDTKRIHEILKMKRKEDFALNFFNKNEWAQGIILRLLIMLIRLKLV